LASLTESPAHEKTSFHNAPFPLYCPGRLKRFFEKFNDPAVKGDLVLIYQMGKVGSQSVESTLRRCLPKTIIARPHYISAEMATLRRGRMHTIRSEEHKVSSTLQVEEADRLREIIALRRRRKLLVPWMPKINIISAVRDPVGLRLAGIFQNHANKFPDLSKVNAKVCEELLPNADRGVLENWFDRELLGVCGVDVYAKPFPHEQGYVICENAHARVLVYRFENIGKLSEMLAEFLRIPPPEIIRENIGAEKAYSSIYAEVKKTIHLPDEFLEKMYSSKLAQHFYTDAERAEFRKRWQNRRQG
jgi:hypothetical protein